jgi:apolipoprotein N-acyltransferase
LEKASTPTPTNLIVWPEAPAPFVENDPQFRSGMSSLARAAQAPVIVDNFGISRRSDPTNSAIYDHFNSASFITPDGNFAGRYDKMHLVPFGEYVPFKSILFFAGSLLAEAGNLSPGTHRTVFAFDGHHYGTFICYESTFADEVRLFVLKGADVLINISDDGWYGDTSAPWQHLDMVRMRAIENHRWVLRATNTGVTAAINPYGKVTTAAPRHIRTAIQVAFGYEHDITFYAAHGDIFAYACALITALAFGFSLRREMH